MSHGQIHFELKYFCSLRQHMYNMYLQIVHSSYATTIICVNFVKIFIPAVVSINDYCGYSCANHDYLIILTNVFLFAYITTVYK